MKEGRANDGGSLVERARAQRLVSSPPSSLSPVPRPPSLARVTADKVLFSPSLSASPAPARVPPPSLVILCTNRYRLGRSHHTPPPPSSLGGLRAAWEGRFRSKRRHAHDPIFHLAFAAGIGVVCGDDGCVQPLSRPVRRALLPPHPHGIQESKDGSLPRGTTHHTPSESGQLGTPSTPSP